MREIKFRGKNAKGVWIYGDLLHNRGETFIAPQGIANPLATRDDYRVFSETVGQYTGMTDKNGKEIYEGYIVNVFCGKEKFPMQVLFHEGEWVLNEYEDDTYNSLYDFKPEELEVIGNIFDNKLEDYQ